MKYSILPDAFTKNPPQITGSYQDFIAEIQKHGPPRALGKEERKRCPLFHPGSRNGPLNRSTIEEIYCFVWDLDDGDEPDELLEQLPSYFAYTSMSHTPEHPRWRVITELSRPVQAGDWTNFFRTVQRLTGNFGDGTVGDASRMYYLPDQAAEIRTKDGPKLDVDDYESQALPIEIVGQESVFADLITVKAVASKLAAKRNDPESARRAQMLEDLSRGIAYAVDGERDAMTFMLCTTLFADNKHYDIEGLAKVFDPVTTGIWGDNPDKIRDKLERAQRFRLGLPSDPGTVLHDASDHVLAGRVLSDLGHSAVGQGSVWQYDEGRWTAVPDTELYTALSQYVGAFVVNTKTLFELTKKRYDGFRGCALLRAEQLPDRQPGVSFQNGFLLPSGELVDHDPAQGARHKVQFDYAPDADQGPWRELLNTVLPDQPRAHDCLAEFTGACLAGVAHQFDKMLFLYGESGNNGKSTILEPIRRLFDPEVVASIPPQDWGNAQKRHALAQVQLNVIGELPSRKMRDSEIFKDLISGAEGIQAKSLYKDEYKFSARFGCVCATNKMFESDDTSGGLMRRIMFIAFSQKFDGKRRREEFTELVQGPGIYAWAMEGLTRLLAQGHYSEPESHAAKMEEWSDDQDPVSEWTRLHTEPTEAPTRARDLYANFMTWYHDKWGPGVMDKKEFCRTLKYNRVKNSGGDSWYPISIKK